jgi:hypothetical protein
MKEKMLKWLRTHPVAEDIVAPSAEDIVAPAAEDIVAPAAEDIVAVLKMH